MNLKHFILIILICLFTSSLSFAYEWDSEKFMSVEEIRAGMKGIALTVLEGTKIDTFEVEIISVMHNVGVGQNRILIRCPNEPVSYSGVVQGMSGSPVYIDGRLIGAISNTFVFSKDAIGGVTPIDEMLKIFDYGLEPAPQGYYPLPEDNYDNLALDFEAEYTNKMDNYSNTDYFPLMVSGASSKLLSIMKAQLQPYDMYPIQSGNTGQETIDNTPLKPGSAVSIVLVNGDLNVAGVGTVTYVDGDNILAFGHPMFHSGNVDFPMAGAYVHTILPSLAISYKISSSTNIIGRIVQDRYSGVAGITGETTQMISLSVNIKTINGKYKNYNFGIINYPPFTPLLIQWCVLSALQNTEMNAGNNATDMHLEIKVKGYEPLILDNFFTGKQMSSSAAYTAMITNRLIANPYEAITIEEIKLDLTLTDKIKLATIESMYMEKDDIKQGDELNIKLFIRPYRDKTFVKKLKFTIPSETSKGMVILWIGSAGVKQNIQGSIAPRLFQPENFADLLKIIQEQENNKIILMQLFSPIARGVIQGKELPCLPPSIFTVMDGYAEQGEESISTLSIIKEKHIPFDYHIINNRAVMLIIE